MYVVPMLRRLGVWVSPIRRKVAPASLSITGLGCFSAAGFTHSITTGLIVTGAAALLLEWRVNERA